MGRSSDTPYAWDVSLLYSYAHMCITDACYHDSTSNRHVMIPILVPLQTRIILVIVLPTTVTTTMLANNNDNQKNKQNDETNCHHTANFSNNTTNPTRKLLALSMTGT